MESHAIFFIVHAHGRRQHEIVEEVLADLDVVIVVIAICFAVIVVCQVRRDADEIKADLILQEVLHGISKDHGKPCIEERPFGGAVFVRVLVQRQKHEDLRIVQRRLAMEGGLHIAHRAVELGSNSIVPHFRIGLHVNHRQEGARLSAPHGIGLIHSKFGGIQLHRAFFYIHTTGHVRFLEVATHGNRSLQPQVIKRTAIEPYIVADGHIDFRQEIQIRFLGVREEGQWHAGCSIMDGQCPIHA